MRKGRLDEIFFVDLPAQSERAQIFAIHLARRRRVAENFDLTLLAENSKDFSGAEIEEAIISAMYDAFYASREVNTEDVLKALQETVPLSRTMDEQINRLRSWAGGRARDASAGRPESTTSTSRRMEF